MTLTTQK